MELPGADVDQQWLHLMPLDRNAHTINEHIVTVCNKQTHRVTTADREW